ncbi:MAG: hypothetical protein IJD28_07820 [Deferribacterales bacterium]|nr:hypothetical protein [Deferribacterales bacterium]
MKYIVTEGTPLKGETIEFLKNLLPEDRQEFLFDKINEAHAINEFMAALKDSRTYCLRMPCGKIIAMGGFVECVDNGEYMVWLLCAEGSEKIPSTLYKTVKKILNSIKWTWLIAPVYSKSVNHIRFVTKGLGFKAAGKGGEIQVYYTNRI